MVEKWIEIKDDPNLSQIANPNPNSFKMIGAHQFLPSSSEGGVVTTPVRFFFFFNSVFCPINCSKRFCVIVYIYYASTWCTYNYKVKFEGVVLVWGIVKDYGRGARGWWNPMIFILSISYIFYKIYAPNVLCRWESSFPYIISQKSCENSIFYDFLAKNQFLLIFMYIFNTSKLARVRWLWRHSDVIWRVQWYSFWYQWIEEVHTYNTLGANIGVSSVPYRKSREGVATTPTPSEDVLQKMPLQDDEG